MESLRILIVEDDLVLASELEEQLNEFGYQSIRSVSNSTDALNAFQNELPDLVLSDINLDYSDLDGIELVRRFNAIHEVPIIFLSALSDNKTITRAKDVKPAYYLVKPYNPSQVKVAIDLAIENFSEKKEANPNASLQNETPVSENFHGNPNSIFIKKGQKYFRVDLDKILWVEALGSNVKIVTAEDVYTLTANLSSFARQVRCDFIVRVHRSYMLNLNQVVSFQGASAFVNYKGEEYEVPIGKTYRSTFQELFFKLSSD